MIKKLFYGFGGLSYSVISQTISTFFMFYATSVLGLSGTLVGIAIAVSTIWDGVSDTIVGYLSDNYPMRKFGKRNGYMFIACIGMSAFNIALWCIPNQINAVIKFIWILVSLLFLETFNTMFATPFSALGNELAENNDDRTKINAYSTIFYLVGIIIPSILMVVFLPNTSEYPIGQLNPSGYVKIAIVSSLICLFFGLTCSFFTIKHSNRGFKQREKFSIKLLINNFLISFKEKELRRIIFGYVCTCVATVFLCSVGLHFFTYSFFYSSPQITSLLLTLIMGTILSQPLWVIVAKKINKKPALIIGILITIFAVFGVITIYLFRIDLYKISFILMLLSVFLCGVGSGAIYSLPNSIYGDLIAKKNSTGKDLTATYSGTITFASNIANSIAQLLVGVLLDVIKFDSTLQVQTLGVQTGLAMILFVGVQTSLILGCFVFSRHKDISK